MLLLKGKAAVEQSISNRNVERVECEPNLPGAQDDSIPSLCGFFLALLASAFFQLSFEFPKLNCFILLYACSLIILSRVSSARLAFRFGFLAGFLVFAPQLAWFWKIFGPAALCLWAVLSFFTGAFVATLHTWRSHFGLRFLWLAAPIFWTGLEYFRGELYFLRFSWLSAGYVFSGHAGLLPVGVFGVYGCGFVVFLLAAVAARPSFERTVVHLAVTTLLMAVLTNSAPARLSKDVPGTPLKVAGIQLEFPPELQVPGYLDRVREKYPDAALLVLSEYTFESIVPKRVRQWCREHRRYLIAGGKKEGDRPGQFYNTAFVVGPTGEIVFEQVKSVPIQFFKDGLPAPEQKVWNSPWGKIAVCVCYDMSYRRVVDRFIRQGAQAMIVPFMDVADWGERQRHLHARVASIRAQEYGIPIFRLGSSGVSQIVDRSGRILASAPYPGQEEIMGGALQISARANLPLDTMLAPVCVVLLAVFICYILIRVFAITPLRHPPIASPRPAALFRPGEKPFPPKSRIPWKGP
ncbi:MAG TPA: nitrilase-related carbon-nitrogen hydrolase [Verrucomicrobiae bacterium]|nr:nitrilase-related carbon-nitrogen hydrolase [Verrucomicrobiae bacterium]